MRCKNIKHNYIEYCIDKDKIKQIFIDVMNNFNKISKTMCPDDDSLNNFDEKIDELNANLSIIQNSEICHKLKRNLKIAIKSILDCGNFKDEQQNAVNAVIKNINLFHAKKLVMNSTIVKFDYFKSNVYGGKYT